MADTQLMLPLETWVDLDRKHQAARKALRELDGAIVEAALGASRRGDPKVAEWLLGTVLEGVADSLLSLPDLHLQVEWLGGDSENPENFTLREPHVVERLGKGQGRASKEEMQRAGVKCAGPCIWYFLDTSGGG